MVYLTLNGDFESTRERKRECARVEREPKRARASQPEKEIDRTRAGGGALTIWVSGMTTATTTTLPSIPVEPDQQKKIIK